MFNPMPLFDEGRTKLVTPNRQRASRHIPYNGQCRIYVISPRGLDNESKVLVFFSYDHNQKPLGQILVIIWASLLHVLQRGV